MSSTTTSLINHNFGGISRKNAIFSQDKITCSDCQNVELYFTKLNSGVGIRTTTGNIAVTTCIPDTEEVIGVFESVHLRIPRCFVYTEGYIGDTTTKRGRLYVVNLHTDTATLKVDNLTVNATNGGIANGVSFIQGWRDYFIFSNGVEIKYIYSDSSTHDELVVETEDIYLYDDVVDESTTSGYREVKGISLAVFDSRLWVSNGNVLWYSKQLECRDFHTIDHTVVTTAGYIEFAKPVTAIANYLGSLAVFHKDSSVLVMLNQSDGTYYAEDESPGGCASYNSLVFHGTDLYFYDDTKKGVFSFQQVVNGDKTLSDNIAYDVQEELIRISKVDLDKIRTLSVITSDRNEVWFLIPLNETYPIETTLNNITTTVYKPASIVLIFDYVRGEWVKRKCQKINTIQIFDNGLYSAGEQVYKEYTTNTFNGDFINSSYICSIFNFGEDNTLKITKFPPRLGVDSSYGNNFYIKYIKNYDIDKAPKLKKIGSKSLKSILRYNTGIKWNDGYRYKPKGVTKIVKMSSATFKALEIEFFTTKESEDFCIKNIEFSKIKVKQV